MSLPLKESDHAELEHFIGKKKIFRYQSWPREQTRFMSSRYLIALAQIRLINDPHEQIINRIHF